MKELLTILAAIPGTLVLFSIFPLLKRFTYKENGEEYIHKPAGCMALIMIPLGFALMYVGINFTDTYISANWPSL